MVFVVGGLTTNILPTNEETLPTFTCSASCNPTKILPTKCLNIAEPRIFCPLKITRYAVYQSTTLLYNYTCIRNALVEVLHEYFFIPVAVKGCVVSVAVTMVSMGLWFSCTHTSTAPSLSSTISMRDIREATITACKGKHRTNISLVSQKKEKFSHFF